MTTKELSKKFSKIVETGGYSFITPNPIAFNMVTAINFELSNSDNSDSKRFYEKVDSLEQAREIWSNVMYDKPKDEMDALFEKRVKTFNVDLTQDLFLTIYVFN